MGLLMASGSEKKTLSKKEKRRWIDDENMLHLPEHTKQFLLKPSYFGLWVTGSQHEEKSSFPLPKTRYIFISRLISKFSVNLDVCGMHTRCIRNTYRHTQKITTSGAVKYYQICAIKDTWLRDVPSLPFAAQKNIYPNKKNCLWRWKECDMEKNARYHRRKYI